MNREEAARILDPSTCDIEFEKDISHWSERLELAMTMGAEALRSRWVKTSDRLPTEADADSELMIMAWHIYFGYEAVAYGSVIDEPERFTYWMPIPPLPEVGK